MSTSENNKRIAKNTLMLYIRMLLSIVVSLYTSRVVLDVLGVEDYGIYGVVGGVVAMFSFLNASMAGATSRFLTFEMGRGDKQRLQDTFSSAMIIHMGIALVVLILAETVGLWFLCNKLVIPEGRMEAAHWVFQCSVISAMFGITQVPYNATIIAHEKMDVYAYIEILNVTSKLLIVFLLLFGDFDKLIFYAILTLVVSMIVMMIYRIYCIRNFIESRFHFIWKKDFLKPILSFSGWNFFGNMCVAARLHGTTFLINMFFGVVVNAASSIATAINSVLSGFAYNIITAFRPRIIKSYSMKDWSEMESTMDNAIKFSTLLFIIVVIPCFFETPYLLDLWLGNVPEYASVFIRITFISNCFSIISSVFNIGIQATGSIKYLSLFSGIAFLLPLPIIYVFLLFGFNVEYAYIVNLFSVVVTLLINIKIFGIYVCEVNLRSILINLLKIVVVVLFTICIIYMSCLNIQYNLLRLLLIGIVSLFSIGTLSYITILNKTQRKYLKDFLVAKMKRKYNK